MTGKEKSRPAVAAAGRTAEAGTVCETASSSTSHDTTAAEVRQIQVSDFLLHGQENAVPRCHLRQLTGLSDRELRKRIELERRKGVAICADNSSGYYLAADELEKRRFVNSMLHRAIEIAKTAAAVGQAEV